MHGMKDKTMCNEPEAGPCPARQSAQDLLRSMARQKHEEASRLEALADFAAHLPPFVDEILWQLALSARQRY
jgi:hypothetical protein